ncbi:DUF6307 family protein [Saccharothrix sp. BKS2]|uniref:DUF6307 family protein n=1 Tax=Saccharothrix sp. BKS2 TaxID=3064400 RepID=UPI0039ECC668
MTASPHLSSYERRVELVRETLSAHSEIGGKEARALAVHVLEALDHIPEKIR